MALDRPVSTTDPAYCTADDVAAVRRERPYAATEARQRHTLAQVKAAIIDAEEEVDRTTRHAWRERKVTDEYRSIDRPADGLGFIRIPLRHRMIRALAAGSGDKVEIRSGTTWEDYLVTRTQGIGGDFWMQESDGTLYVKQRYFLITRDGARVTYRYGEVSVPRDVKRATALLAAAHLEDTQRRAAGDAGDARPVADRADEWRRQAYALLRSHIQVGGGA